MADPTPPPIEAGQIECASCEERRPEAGAHEAGWRFATFCPESGWLCRQCHVNDCDEVQW